MTDGDDTERERPAGTNAHAAGSGAPSSLAASSHGTSGETPVIAFFDIDNTLIRGATVYLVAFGAWRLKLLRIRDVASFAWQQTRFIAVGENMKHTAKAKDRSLQMIAGHTEAELRELGEEVYRRQITQR